MVDEARPALQRLFDLVEELVTASLTSTAIDQRGLDRRFAALSPAACSAWLRAAYEAFSATIRFVDLARGARSAGDRVLDLPSAQAAVEAVQRTLRSAVQTRDDAFVTDVTALRAGLAGKDLEALSDLRDAGSVVAEAIGIVVTVLEERAFQDPHPTNEDF